MTSFSASDAALEGVNLIRRRWRVVLGWAGFNLLSLVMLVVLTVVLSLVASAVSGGAQEPVEIFAALLVLIGTTLVQATIAVGVFRVEIRPDEPAFLHLRLGRDELRLIAVWLVTVTGIWVVGWAAALLGGALGAGEAWVMLLGTALLVYLGVRFLLVAPISFNEGRIDFVRSWRLTRGRVGALFGMWVLSLCLIGLIMVAVFVVLALIAAGAAGLEGVVGLFGGADALKQHPGLYVLEFAVEIILTPVLWILGMAPLAAAYRALAVDEPPQA
jgi:hypothetical protein